MKKIYLLLLAIICSVGQMWGDQREFNGVTITFSGTQNGSGWNYYPSDNNPNQTFDLGIVSSTFTINTAYLKFKTDWSDRSGFGGQLCYKINNGDVKYLGKEYWNEFDKGNNEYEKQNLNCIWEIAKSTDPSGHYTFEHWWQMWMGGADFYISNSNSNYKFTYTILPPAANVTVAGALAGDGSEAKPYVFLPGATMTIGAEQAHADVNSHLMLKVGTGEYGNNAQTMQINEAGSVVVKAKYANSTENIESAETEKNIHYAILESIKLVHDWPDDGKGSIPSHDNMTLNANGTYSLFAQYGENNQFKLELNGAVETAEISNIQKDDQTGKKDFCEFILNFEGTTPHLTIRKLPTAGTLGINGWSTFYSVSNFSISGVTAYIATAYNAENKTITLSPLGDGIIPTCTGVILKGTQGDPYNITYQLDPETVSTDGNLLKGTGTYTTTASLNPTNKIFMALNNTKGAFQRYTGDEFPANKAFLLVDVPASGEVIERIPLIIEEATSVENTELVIEAIKYIENGQLFIEKNGRVYNAMGQIVR